jgi:hypothetical protein
MQAELRNIGYTVTDDPATAHVIGGSVIKVYCDSYLAYDGRVTVKVRLYEGKDKVFEREYEGQNKKVNVSARAKTFGCTLETALQRALLDAIKDIDQELATR